MSFNSEPDLAHALMAGDEIVSIPIAIATDEIMAAEDLGSNLNRPLFQPLSPDAPSAIPDLVLNEVHELLDDTPTPANTVLNPAGITKSSNANGAGNDIASSRDRSAPRAQSQPSKSVCDTPGNLPLASTSKAAPAIVLDTPAEDSTDLSDLSDAEAHIVCPPPPPPPSGKRYTVARKMPNTKDSRHVIKLIGGHSDGHRRRWPTELKQAHGYRRVDLGDAPDIAYKLKLGENLAKLLGEQLDSKGLWTLAALPEDYGLFVATRDSSRSDVYLYGSHRFRSPAEFTPHLFWLYDSTTPKPRCKCKYCNSGKRSQRDINETIGITSLLASIATSKRRSMGSERANSVASNAVSPLKSKKRKLDMTTKSGGRVDSPVVDKSNKVGSEVASTSPGPAGLTIPLTIPNGKPGASAVPKKVMSDVGGKKTETNVAPEFDSKGDSKESRAPASYAGSYPDRARDTDLHDGALFRKGEMIWAQLVRPIADINGGGRQLTHWPGLITARAIKTNANVAAGAIETKQHFEYHIALLACTDEFKRPEDQIKPWLVFPPPNEIATVGIEDPASVNFVWDGKQAREPRLEELATIPQATTTFALALQIAAHIIASFTLSDRYTITSEHITSAPNLTPQEVVERDRSLKHSYYQSLWWGGERIWSGELVRLMTDNNSVDPSAGSIRSPGSEARGTFLRISGLFKDAKLSRAMVAGVIYELREDNSKFENIADDINKDSPPLPPAPDGYSYRRITACNITQNHVAQIKENIRRSVMATKEAVDQWESSTHPVVSEKEMSEEHTRSLVLAGLLPSYMLFMRCNAHCKDRAKAIAEAKSKAQSEMAEFFSPLSPST